MANLVMTTRGLMERESLTMKEVFGDLEDHCFYNIEYWFNGERVKNIVEVHIKKGVEVTLEIG